MHIEPRIPRIVRGVKVGRPAVVAVAALACAALVGACGSSSSSSNATSAPVNTVRVAQSIEESILKERHLRSKVVCPASVPSEVGKTFECIATTRSAKPPFAEVKTPFVVTIQNNRGFVTYVGK
jgi:hypothetical protein